VHRSEGDSDRFHRARLGYGAPLGNFCPASGNIGLVSGIDASGTKSTDGALIGDSVSNPECFSVIFERHGASVFRYLASRVDRSSAEDLLADVFEAAFRARQRYDTRSDGALPWLLGIASNMIRHHRRSQVRRTSMLRRITHLEEQGKSATNAMDPPAASAEQRDQMQGVRRALDALDDKHREVLVLSAGLGLSYDDIGRALGIRVGTVRSRVFRARANLRELLEADGQYTAYAKSDHRSTVAEEHRE
jgi:RNA polymerase sigma factor (sigma-70 family)